MELQVALDLELPIMTCILTESQGHVNRLEASHYVMKWFDGNKRKWGY